MIAGEGVEVGASDTDEVGDTVKVGLGEGDSEGTEEIGGAWAFDLLKNGSKFTV